MLDTNMVVMIVEGPKMVYNEQVSKSLGTLEVKRQGTTKTLND